ncbi:transporter, partial [Klebsiella pneumoniae]
FIMTTRTTLLIPALKPYLSLGNDITREVGLLCVTVRFFG